MYSGCIQSVWPRPNYLRYYIIRDYHLWPIVYYLRCTRASSCVPDGMGSNPNSLLQKMVLNKGAFYPPSFLCVHWWTVESPLFWYRMPYGSFIVCMFWIRWRCQPTCAICRCCSGLENYLRKICQRISCHIQWEKSFCMRIGGNGTAPRRSVTRNGEPILWKSQIRHLGEFITHDLSDLNDITY